MFRACGREMRCEYKKGAECQSYLRIRTTFQITVQVALKKPLTLNYSGSVAVSYTHLDVYKRQGNAYIGLNYAIPSNYDKLNFWVYGDNSGAQLALGTDTGLSLIHI